MPALEQANALIAGDATSALASLIAAWRERRLPVLAALIEQLAAIAPGALEAKLAKRLPGRIKAGIAALERLLAEDDPRVASHLHGLVIRRPFGGVEFELALLDLIVRAGDPRSIEVLAHHAGMDGDHARAKLLARFAAVPSPGPAEQQLIASIRDRIATLQTTTEHAAGRGAELLAAIRAEPHDDRPRAIYADWLQERGDPYGEFIALQLARNGTKREQQLVRKHGKAWMGRLGVIADLARSRFSRGFPSHLVLHYRALHDELAAVAGAAEWWSVEELDRGDRLVPDPAMRSLRAIGMVNQELAARLATSDPPLPLTSLGVFIEQPTFPTEAPGLPQLLHLTLHHHGHPTASLLLEALASPIAKQLRSLAHQAARVRLTLTADRDGALTQLRLDVPHAEPELVNEVRILARGAPVSSIELVVTEELRENTVSMLRAAGVPPLVVTSVR